MTNVKPQILLELLHFNIQGFIFISSDRSFTMKFVLLRTQTETPNRQQKNRQKAKPGLKPHIV